jgi:hypothetical protein
VHADGRGDVGEGDLPHAMRCGEGTGRVEDCRLTLLFGLSATGPLETPVHECHNKTLLR